MINRVAYVKSENLSNYLTYLNFGISKPVSLVYSAASEAIETLSPVVVRLFKRLAILTLTDDTSDRKAFANKSR